MKQYIIDGNNLIGKHPKLKGIQKKDKQSAREQLAFTIENYFTFKKANVSLHLDGYESLPIKISNTRIIYSQSGTADEMIKKEIDNSKNPKNIIIVSSDNNIREYARAYSCEIISSEEFAGELNKPDDADVEQKIIDRMSVNEFKKLFGEDD